MSVGAVNKQTGERIQTAGMPAVDSVLSGVSTNPVQNRVVKAAFDGKQDTLTFDNVPTDGSNNPVKSNGIYGALATKANTDMVAADFNATASYTAGDYCIYEGKFYKFKASHSGAWSASDVDEIKIAGELSSLKSGLTGLTARIAYVEFTLSDTIDTQVTVSTPAGFNCGNSVVMGCSYQRTNDLWYDANAEHIIYGAFSDSAYAIPKANDTLGCKCRIAFLKIVIS